MKRSARAVSLLSALAYLILCGEALAVPPPSCETNADCADPCRTGDRCDPVLQYCRYDGAEPDGKACTSDGDNHTADYCWGGACQHLIDCSTEPGDYCLNQTSGGCTVSSCLPYDVAPGSPYNFQSWSCHNTLIPDGGTALFKDGAEPIHTCNHGWVCQSGTAVPASPYTFQENKTCRVNQDLSAGMSKCDGVFVDRCRPNRFVSNCKDPGETLGSITPYTEAMGWCYTLVTAPMLSAPNLPATIPAGKMPGWIELPGPQFATQMVEGMDPNGPRTGEYVSVMTHDLSGNRGTQPSDYDLPVVILEGFDPDQNFGWSNEGWNGLLFPALYGPNGIAYDGYDVVYVGQANGWQSTRDYARGAARAIAAAAAGFPNGSGSSQYPAPGKVFVFGISEGGLITKMVLSAWEACHDPAFQSNSARCPDWFPPELKSIDPAVIVAAALTGDSPIEGAHIPRSFQSFLRKASLDCPVIEQYFTGLIAALPIPIIPKLLTLADIQAGQFFPTAFPFEEQLGAVGFPASGLLDVPPAREMLIRWVDDNGATFDANTTAPRSALGSSVAPIYSEANRYGIGFPAQSSGHGYPEHVKLYGLSEGAWRTGGVSRSVTNCLGWNNPIGCSGALGEAHITSPLTHMAWLDPSGSACYDQHIMYADAIDIGEGSAIAAIPRDMAYKMVQRNHGIPGVATTEGDVIWQGLNGDGLCNGRESQLNSVDCPYGPISGGQAFYAELPSLNMGLRFNWMRAWNYSPTASALGCYGPDANGDRLPDGITPVSTEADCQNVIASRGGYGFSDVYWQEKGMAHDSLAYEYKEMPKTYAFLRSVLDEHMKGDGDGYFDHCKDLSAYPPETEANYPALAAEKWGKGKWKACDECPGDPTSHTHAGCLSASQSTADWRRVARAGFPTTCVNATGAVSKPTLCPYGDLPQVVSVTLLDDEGHAMPGVPRADIVATGTCRLLAPGGTGTCGPLDANNVPTTWVNQIQADADTDALGKTSITIPGAIGDCSDLRIVARGRTLATLAFRSMDFSPRTGLTAQSGSVGATEFNSLSNSLGRTDRDWMDFNCSGVIDSPDFNMLSSLHMGHKCTP